MPAARGSRSEAYRSARARALNWHSTMWCALRPYGHVHVQRDLGLGDEGLQDVPGHRRVVLADHRRHLLGLGVHEVRAAGQVDGHLGEGLVQRDRAVAEAVDADLVAERLLEGGAEREGGVLDGVVRVDVQVALGLHGQVEQTVPAELVEHVVVEADACRHIDLAGAVEIDLDEDRRLLGGAFHASDAAHDSSCSFFSSRTASRNASFSAGVPAVTRSHPGTPLSRTRTPWSRIFCQAAWASAKRAELHEVGVGLGDVEADGAQFGDQPVPLGLQLLDVLRAACRCAPGRPARWPG